jgi:hypothetical protein
MKTLSLCKFFINGSIRSSSAGASNTGFRPESRSQSCEACKNRRLARVQVQILDARRRYKYEWVNGNIEKTIYSKTQLIAISKGEQQVPRCAGFARFYLVRRRYF